MTPQEPPFSIHLEPAEGCTLACSFCALQSIRDNGANAEQGVHGVKSTPFRFMSVDLAERIAYEIKRLGWNPRIEFDMHGEPTANQQLAEIINVTRQLLPKVSILVTSNGSGLLTMKAISNLFDAGLNTLAFDDYKHAQWRQRTRTALEGYSVGMRVPLIEYPADPEGNPHRRFHKKRIVVIKDISDNTEGTHTLTNQGGNSFLSVLPPMKARCAKPFRELSVRWDGNVAVCCDDWKGEYKIANVWDQTLDQVWNHPRFHAARRMLYDSNRAALRPCNRCNVVTYRNGLLPDKMGLTTLDPPDSACWDHVHEANGGTPFSVKI